MNTLELLKLTPEQKYYGIWLEEEYDSEYKEWWRDNNQICHFIQWKNNKRDGIKKWWDEDGKLIRWELRKDDKVIKNYLK